jgi:hypothetical protein
MSGVATDEVPSIVGSKSGVVAKIQSELFSRNIRNENFLVFHCILHQQNLCAKSVKFKEIMKAVVSCVNYSVNIKLGTKLIAAPCDIPRKITRTGRHYSEKCHPMTL